MISWNGAAMITPLSLLLIAYRLLLPAPAACEDIPVRVRLEQGGRGKVIIFECATAGTSLAEAEDLTLYWTINGPTQDRPGQRPWAAPEFLWPKDSRRLGSGKVASPMSRLGSQSFRIDVPTDRTIWRINYAVDSANRYGNASHRMRAVDLSDASAALAADAGPKASHSAQEAKTAPSRTQQKASPLDDIWSIRLVDHAGQPAKLADFRCKALLLMYRFDGCSACAQALPKIDQLYPDVRRLGGEIAAIDPVDAAPAPTPYPAKSPWRFPSLFDPQNETLKFCRPRGYPTFFLLNEKGVVVKTWVGLPPSAIEEMRREIAALTW